MVMVIYLASISYQALYIHYLILFLSKSYDRYCHKHLTDECETKAVTEVTYIERGRDRIEV